MAVTINGSAGVTTNSGAVYDSLQRGTAVTASGTSVDFTSIPSWVRRITVMFSGISLNGSDNIIIQIGSGSISTSGYASSAAFTGTSAGGGTSTAGFVVTNAPVASSTFSGSATIVNISGNTWISTGSLIYESTTPTPFVILSTGIRSLSGVLDRVSVTRTGTNTFDAGTINIIYE